MNVDDIDAIVFDFDGVLTNNIVHINEDGEESVSCSRSDGLAFDVLRKLEVKTFILSTEKNNVVAARAAKLKVPVFHGVDNKVNVIEELTKKFGIDLNRVFYVGNDLNDYRAMQQCGYTACPADGHELIKNISDYELRTKGGCGVVRELIENVFEMDVIEILYTE